MSLTWFNFILLALASFRLTRLLVFDKITEFLRKPFIDEVTEVDENGQEEIYLVPTEKNLISHFIGQLLSCYWCTGIWVSGGLLILVFFAPEIIAQFIVWLFAIAGLAAIFETMIQKWLD